jgi:hypothetical protein
MMDSKLAPLAIIDFGIMGCEIISRKILESRVWGPDELHGRIPFVGHEETNRRLTRVYRVTEPVDDVEAEVLIRSDCRRRGQTAAVEERPSADGRRERIRVDPYAQ